MNKKLAIVGIFYDGYYDLWEDFLELFSINWHNCPYDLYIVNNEKELDFEKKYNVKVLHAGKEAEYSRKVQTALSDIDADYYFLLLEDFLLSKNIEKDPLQSIIQYMKRENVLYYRLQLPEFSKNRSNLHGPQLIDPSSEYTVSCQPSIWKKSFLKKCIGERNYNAWIFEGIYVYSKTAHSKKFLSKCRVDYSNPLDLRHLAVQGKLLPDVYQHFVNSGYIFRTNRELLSNKAHGKHLKKQRFKRILPIWAQKLIKRFIKNESIVEKYKKEIKTEMKYLKIE